MSHNGLKSRAYLTFAAGLALSLVVFAPARAEFDNTPLPSAAAGDVGPLANGAVNAMARDADGTTYIAGSFTWIGPSVGYGASLSLRSGDYDPDFAEVDGGSVEAVAADGHGGWYIGGQFSSVGGVTQHGLAHILADGSVDPGWDDPNVEEGGPVKALAVSGSTVYVGGSFTEVGGQPRMNLAAVDAATGKVTPWRADVGSQGYWVAALAVSGSNLYIGGDFHRVAGVRRDHLAAIDAATGLVTRWDPAANDPVHSVAVSGSTVYVGGTFTALNRGSGLKRRNSLAAIDASTGVATSWDPDVDAWNFHPSVSAILVSGSTVYVGGGFEWVNHFKKRRNNLAAFDASTGEATSWNPNPDYSVSGLGRFGSTIYAVGNFTRVRGVDRNYAAAVDATTGRPTRWNPSANFSLRAIGISVGINGARAYVGGNASSYHATRRNGLAAFDADGELTNWDPNAGSAWPVGDQFYALAVSGSTVYVGGHFEEVGGEPRHTLAAIDKSTGQVLPWSPDVEGPGQGCAPVVNSLLVSGDTVYAGGCFIAVNGLSRNSLAAIDEAGNVLGFNPNVGPAGNSIVIALAPDGTGSTLYFGGQISSVGGQPRNNLAAVDAATGEARPWNPNSDDLVFALATSGSTVYAGGMFSTVGGKARRHIAALDGSTGDASPWDPNIIGPGLFEPPFILPGVHSLALDATGSTVYAGGNFYMVGMWARNYLAGIDASTGVATAWDPRPDGPVFALAIEPSTAYVGGYFAKFGQTYTGLYARFAPPEPARARRERTIARRR